jgi:hypothetical protein
VVALTPLQQQILACVRAHPGQFTRSGLAKLLAGSASARLDAAARRSPYYGACAGRGRKHLTGDIDVLVQQGYLALNGRQRLCPLLEEM